MTFCKERNQPCVRNRQAVGRWMEYFFNQFWEIYFNFLSVWTRNLMTLILMLFSGYSFFLLLILYDNSPQPSKILFLKWPPFLQSSLFCLLTTRQVLNPPSGTTINNRSKSHHDLLLTGSFPQCWVTQTQQTKYSMREKALKSVNTELYYNIIHQNNSCLNIP